MSVSNAYTYFHEIWFLMGRDRKRLPFLFVFFLGISLIDIAGIGLVGPYIALVVDPDSYQKLPEIFEWTKRFAPDRHSLIVFVGGGLVLLFTLKACVGILIDGAIFRFSLGRAAQLRIDLMRAYMAMPYERHLESNSARMVQTVQDFTAQFVEQTLIPMLRLVSEGVISIVILCFLAWVHGYAFALMVLLMSPSLYAYDKVFRSRMLMHGKMANLEMGKLLTALKEGVNGLREVRILGVEKYYRDMFEKGAISNAGNIAKAKTIITVPRYLLELTLVSFIVVLTVGAIWFEGRTDNILPVLGVFGVAAMRLIPSANSMMGGVSKLRVGRHSTDMLYRDLSEIQTHLDPSEPPDGAPIHAEENRRRVSTLEFRDVHYRYPTSHVDSLNGVSLSLVGGESIGLIGRSGSGKTTLVNVMLGLLRCHKGEVVFNGESIKNCMAAWRSHVAYLPQQVFIADSSIRCNVALGIPDNEIDDVAVWDAVNQACLKELIESLPNGLDTPLGENGARLSGGQRQRIALARAFYHDRDVLIMDESTSALDTDTERAVVEAIKALHGKKTMVVIAHRMSTVEHCDKIYRLDNGRIRMVDSTSHPQHPVQ